jgi:hypothetical protein
MRIDDNIFRWQIDPSWVGQTVYIKIQPWNLYGGGLVSEASLTATTYVVSAAQEIPDTPPAPGSFTASGAANGVLLQWVNSIPAAVDITSVEYSSNGTSWFVLGQVKGTSYTHVFSGNSTYYYRIRSRSAHYLWSPYSNTLTQSGGSLDFVVDGNDFQRAQQYSFGNSASSPNWLHAGTLVLTDGSTASFFWSTGSGNTSNGNQQSQVTVIVRAGNGALAPNLSGVSAWQEGGSRGLLNSLDSATASVAFVATGESASATNTSWEVYFNCNASTEGLLTAVINRTKGDSFTFDGSVQTPNTSVVGSYVEVLGIGRADDTGAIVTDGLGTAAATDVIVGKVAGPTTLTYAAGLSECAIGAGPYTESMEVVLTAVATIQNSGTSAATIYVGPFDGNSFSTEYQQIVMQAGEVLVYSWETEVTLPSGEYISQGASGGAGSPCDFYFACLTSGGTFSLSGMMQKIEVIKR